MVKLKALCRRSPTWARSTISWSRTPRYRLHDHADKLMRLAPSGARTEIMDRGCGGLHRRGASKTGRCASDLIVHTTGGLLEGGKKPARGSLWCGRDNLKPNNLISRE